MIERHSGKMQLVCQCGTAGKVYAAEDFSVMISEAKAAGWSVQKVAGEWKHGCPDCAALSLSKGQPRKGTLL